MMPSTRALVLLLSSVLLVSACAPRDRSFYPSQAATPMNHPAPPKPRPAPPADFLASLADGKSLTVPAGGQQAAAVPAAAVPAAVVEVQALAPPSAKPQEAALPPAPAPAPSVAAARDDATPPAAGLPANRYRVQKGDSLYGISRRFAVPLRSLADANGLSSPYSLKVSQVLVIPGAASEEHKVARGETLYGIARDYGVEMSALAAANGLNAPYSLSPGQSLSIPRAAAGTQVANARPATEKATAAPAAADSRTETPSSAGTAPAVSASRGKIPPPPPLSGGKFLWPIEGKVVSTFGAGTDGRRNDGINIIAPRGAPVRAVENGVVAYAGEELRGFGRLLLIKHADGWVTAYAHNDVLLVQRGDIVQRGQPVAKVGSSGNVANPQLHFEIRKGSRAVDPTQLLQPSTIASAN